VFWIGDCLAQRHKGKIYHGYNAAFLVAGERASCLVETGHPKDFPVIERHMNELFARGVAPLKYLFVTHQETPHCGGLGRVLKTHPEAILCGDVSDYHLAFPQYEHRMRWMQEGDEIELGGRTLMAVEPVIRDLRTTWWGFDTRERVLFPGDGFAYSHYHEDGHCGLVAEEAVSLDLPDVSAVFADLALFWTKFANMDAYCDRLDQLIERLGVKTIAPTHGLPITDVKATVPRSRKGSKRPRSCRSRAPTRRSRSAAPHRRRPEPRRTSPLLKAYPLKWTRRARVCGSDCRYCPAMWLARMTSPHSLISRLSKALAASGVCSSAGNTSMPPSAKVLRTLASASAWRSAALSRSTIGRGVPAGTSSMCQKSRSSFL
jgi:hypothetical protein